MDRGESLEASGTSTESSKPTGIDASTTESDGLPPFDIEEDDGGGHFAFDKDSNEDEDGEFFEAQEGHLPTMPGYDESVSRNRNCFSEPDISIFSVRGIDYFESSRKKKKVQSGPFLLRARGCDLFLFERSEECDLSNRTHETLGGQLRAVPTLSINFKFPWGYMNLYFEIPENLVVYMNSTKSVVDDPELSASERTLVAWLQGDTDYRNDRLKLIPYVSEGPWVVRNMVTGKPAIIGRKLPIKYKFSPATTSDCPLLTATLDIGSSSATAKRIVSVCRRYMSALTVDIGFVIQAETQDELPEQMLGAVRVHHPDPQKAPKL